MDYELVFQSSYDRTIENKLSEKDFFSSFYERFLKRSDVIKNKFSNTDMIKQKKMLEKSLKLILVK